MSSLIKIKKTQSHVEMIVSFVIFVGFVVAMFFIFNPIKTIGVNKTFLDITQEKIISNWTITYQTLSIIINSSTNQKSCIKIENKPALSQNFIVKDQSENILSSGHDINYDYFWFSSAADNRYYLLIFSELFQGSSLPDCQYLLKPGEYSLGSSNTYNTVLYENMASFIEAYNKDYEKLKFNLGLQNDFMFNIYDEDNNLLYNTSRLVSKQSRVIARDIPVLTINQNTELKHLTINLRVW